MAVAAYAYVTSLLHVLDQVQHPARRRLLPNPKQIETLHEKVHFLQEFLELHSATKIEGMEDLMKQITEVTCEAEDVIDSHVVDQLRQEHEDETDDMGLSLLFSEDTNDDGLCEAFENKMDLELSTSFCHNIDKVIEKIDSIKEELFTMDKAEGKAAQEQQPPIISVRAGSSTLLPPRGNNSTHVVGFDERLVRVMDELTGNQPELQIIPIVGMGGIGKTTLAQFAFENKCVVEKFDVRVWFTISQEYSAHEILLGILSDIGVSGDLKSDLKSETLAQLGLRLYKYLFRRRYLIVMDDLWSTKGWDDFKLSFPNDVNGSRVMVTTRLKDVAASLGSHNTYTMDFLDEDNSWNLLCEKAFTQGSCSPDLEEIGKKIAKGCKGLPLAIVVIGGLLAKSNMTREYWEFVAGKVKMLVSSTNDEDCSKILSLSYNHLPIHLKPCFLYMGFFLKDCEIEVFDLIESWVNEGFLKPVRGKSLEQVANEYLKDLIDRNLILIRRRGELGDITGCGVHDLLRDLCKREALNEHFLSVPKSQQSDFYVTGNNEIGRSKDIVGPRSAELFGPLVGHPNPHLVRLRLCGVREDMFYEKLPLYTKLRYLFLHTPHLDPLSLSTIIQLWKLQTLCILSVLHTLVLPSEIWEMPQLMHIIIHKDFSLPQIERKDDFIVLENLHTLVKIREFRCTEDVVKRIPNLKELKIGYNYRERERDLSYYCLHNIANLRKLESLVLHKWKFTCGNIAFPYSLKKLVLYWCIIPWEDMTVIGSLPNLEVLKLGEAVKKYSMRTDEWDPVEDGFRQLKFLYVFSPHLRRWRAESIHFPKLEILQLRRMDELEEIPTGIGEIETLRKIEVEVCSSSVINSAKEIYEEQQSFGNEDFQLIINFERYQN